jgi:hypothetical protein
MANSNEDQGKLERRRQVLAAHGARGKTVGELLEFNQCRVDPDCSAPSLPLDDEPHLEAWRDYAEDARDLGAWRVLRPRFAQLQFPIREGMSGEEAYRRATRRGEIPVDAGDGEGLQLASPDELVLEIHPSLGGTIPILSTSDRADFVVLVRAFTARGEPAPVPDSMGACLVSGLNNWDRIRRYRRSWETADPANSKAGAWTAEFRRLVPRKEIYQDRFIILSRGPYSNVAADEMGLDEPEWIEQSYRIRREHECTHYFTLRIFGRIQHNVLEEIVADFVGTIHGFGEYRSEAALRFLGLEMFPTFHPGGRLEVYRGDPPISDGAFDVVKTLSVAAVRNLAGLAGRIPDLEGGSHTLAAMVYTLTPLTLEELAADDAVERIEDAIAAGSSD